MHTSRSLQRIRITTSLSMPPQRGDGTDDVLQFRLLPFIHPPTVSVYACPCASSLPSTPFSWIISTSLPSYSFIASTTCYINLSPGSLQPTSALSNPTCVLTISSVPNQCGALFLRACQMHTECTRLPTPRASPIGEIEGSGTLGDAIVVLFRTEELPL